MRFEEALEVMRYDGARVKRNKWTSAFLYIKDEHLYLGREGSDKSYRIKFVDAKCVMTDDWERV